jgi:hypothetical protein
MFISIDCARASWAGIALAPKHQLLSVTLWANARRNRYCLNELPRDLIQKAFVLSMEVGEIRQHID